MSKKNDKRVLCIRNCKEKTRYIISLYISRTRAKRIAIYYLVIF